MKRKMKRSNVISYLTVVLVLTAGNAALWGQTPRTAEEFCNRGDAYYGNGDYERAIADFTEALRLDPDNAYAYGSRANAYYDKGDLDRAIADFEAVLRLDPNDALAKEILDDLRRERGR